MKRTITGFRLNRNGKPITTLSALEVAKDSYLGSGFKENGTYYFYMRKQNGKYIYQE